MLQGNTLMVRSLAGRAREALHAQVVKEARRASFRV